MHHKPPLQVSVCVGMCVCESYSSSLLLLLLTLKRTPAPALKKIIHTVYLKNFPRDPQTSLQDTIGHQKFLKNYRISSQLLKSYPQDLIVQLHLWQKSEKPPWSFTWRASLNFQNTFKGTANLPKDHRQILLMLFKNLIEPSESRENPWTWWKSWLTCCRDLRMILFPLLAEQWWVELMCDWTSGVMELP